MFPIITLELHPSLICPAEISPRLLDTCASLEYRGTMSSILKRGMTPTHEMMGEWILENPGGTLLEMGAFFGYSESWLSQVVNSDMFKSYMAGRMKDVQAYVSMDIPQKMAHLAEISIERMTEVMKKSEDADVIKDSFDKVMHRYGYAPNARNAIQPHGPGPAIGQQNNVFFLSQTDLDKVRGKFIEAHANPALPQPREPVADASLVEEKDT